MKAPVAFLLEAGHEQRRRGRAHGKADAIADVASDASALPGIKVSQPASAVLNFFTGTQGRTPIQSRRVQE